MSKAAKRITSHLKVGVIGGGNFGTAIALLASRNNHKVHIFDKVDVIVDGINLRHDNPSLKMTDFKLPSNIHASKDVSEVTNDADVVFMALPAQQIPTWLETHKYLIPKDTLLCNTAKGLCAEDGGLLSNVVKQVLNRDQPYAVLSGPSFAKEIIQNQPTAVVVASQYLYHAVNISRILSSSHFRCYPCQDVVGTELGGALKNPLAIGAGIIDGLGMGMNTKAAFITLSSAELKLLCHAMGGQPETIAGLAGIGDLMLTCFGELSRNRSMGYRLAKGESAESIMSDMTVEGYNTAKVVVRYANDCGLELPIFRAINDILEGKVELKDAGFRLLGKHMIV